MNPRDGGAAFPAPTNEGTGNLQCWRIEPGMTLRDYFAAQALVLLPASRSWIESEAKRLGVDQSAVGSKCAYEWADAMLRERAK